MGSAAKKITNVRDAEFFAERHLPRLIRDFVRGGSGARYTVQANVSAYGDITFRPRVAVQHPAIELATTVLGHGISMPLMIAPTGGGRVVHPDGERGGVRAAGAAGTIQWISTFSGTPIEEIMADARGPVFFQLYYPGSREAAEPLLERAHAAGCAALVLTADTTLPRRTEIPARGRVALYAGADGSRRPLVEYLRLARIFGAKPRWTAAFLRDRAAGLHTAMVLQDGQPTTIFRSSQLLIRCTPVWADVPWIRQRWPGPVILKGILTPEDARRAVSCGVDAIVVSNHGGNMLDGDPATITVLADIVDEVGGEVEVYVDGGIRRGGDVVKALAVGARAVLIGRPWLWGCAAGGSDGVRAVLEVLRTETRETMAGLGCRSVHELDRSYVRLPAHWLAPAADRR
jgi:isopentenyl diphosphate isomerase/L-lactate dehydrogenase-like FMN-dependent dehydrogenase